MTTNFTIDQILRGTSRGRMQSVGQMSVIPLIGEDDDTFAPPSDLGGSTRGYGQVHVRNDADRPTIVPPGAAWVVDQQAQDHAVGSGALVKAKSSRTLDHARCIQQSQPGLIKETKDAMTILPVALRTTALSIRKEGAYDMLWEPLRKFKARYGLTGAGHLDHFLSTFKRELDEFIAQFELVPQQVGAIVLIGGAIVGVERAPSAAFWEVLWTPLIRVCYGSLAIEYARKAKTPPKTRVPLTTKAKTLKELAGALAQARAVEEELSRNTMVEVQSLELTAAPSAEDALGKARLVTIASKALAGQIVTNGKDSYPFASLCAANV